MDELVPVVPMQVDLPTSNPVERNDKQDGLGESKQAAARKDGGAPKGNGQKTVKETSKSVRKAPNSTATKRTIDKTTKPTKIAAKKVDKTKATRDKSPLKMKAAAKSKDKKPKKSSKKAGVKKSSAKSPTKAIRK